MIKIAVYGKGGIGKSTTKCPTCGHRQKKGPESDAADRL